MTASAADDRAAFANDFDVSRETLSRLDVIVGLLDIWRQRTNLIGPKEWPQIWSRHIADSYQLVPFIPDTCEVIDLGSGAGFPGLVIAAARPAGHVTLVESIGKKAAFLRAAIAAAALPATVRAERVETLQPFDVDVVTARAFAPLPRLLAHAAPWLTRPGATGLFLKGERWKEELTDAQQNWIFSSQAIPSRTGGGSGVIVIVRELGNRHGQA